MGQGAEQTAKSGDEGRGSIYFETIRATLRPIFKAQLENHQGLGYTELAWEAGDLNASPFCSNSTSKLHILKHFNKCELSMYISLNNTFNGVSLSSLKPTEP